MDVTSVCESEMYIDTRSMYMVRRYEVQQSVGLRSLA